MSRGNDVIQIVSANFENGGFGPDGGKDRWHMMTAFLRDQSPDIVLCQEIRGSKPGQAGEHLLATARQAGMTPAVLGPPAPEAASGDGNRTAILVRERPGLTVLDRGPAGRAPRDALPWCDALLEIPAIPCPVRFYSVHLPHSSGVRQLDFASRLATWIAERREAGEAAVAGGDWNCLSPADDYKLAAYRTAHGYLNVPGTWTTEDGFPLGQWLIINRVQLRAGTLDPGRAADLEALGVTAETRAQAAFQRGLDALDAFTDVFGHARVPISYVASGGFRLGRWIARQRTCQDQMPAASKAALDERGMIWDPHAAAFAEGLDHLDAYIAENKHPHVPSHYIAPDGYHLGAWLSRRRERHNNPRSSQPPLIAGQATALAKRGIPWHPAPSRDRPRTTRARRSAAQPLTGIRQPLPDGDAPTAQMSLKADLQYQASTPSTGLRHQGRRTDDPKATGLTLHGAPVSTVAVSYGGYAGTSRIPLERAGLSRQPGQESPACPGRCPVPGEGGNEVTGYRCRRRDRGEGSGRG